MTETGVRAERAKYKGWEPPDDGTHQPFLVFCSREHNRKLLHRGILVTEPGVPARIEWVGRGQRGLPHFGEPKPDGDRTVGFRCPDRYCRLDRRMQVSEAVRAVQALAAAGHKDTKGRVVLDIAYVPR